MCRESPCQLGEWALSFVMRRGGPSGAPLAATGQTASTPSKIAAIFVPSGDQAGPQPPLESIDFIGSGAYHLSVLAAPAVAIVNTWLVPSRNRRVSGATSASATTLPSGDHVGAPGCAS